MADCDILLSTLTARYIHAAFGLRYLRANLPGGLYERSAIAEFDINQRPTDIVERLLAFDPAIVALGVYIWNVVPTTQVVSELKRLRPEITLILGGPEVSHETDSQPICALADYVITGEADLAFADLCRRLISGDRPPQKVIAADLPTMHELRLPYHLYTDEDLRHRIIYVEASRGCPFKCEFCLSSLDVPVRNVPLEPLLSALADLLDRGATQFKFVDRTFNLNLNVSRRILQFFLQRYRPGLFLHFEMIPDRLPEPLRELIAAFPPGALQLEVGIQSFDQDVTARINRRQDNARVEENLRFVRQQTGAHIHADLIAGLPGEDLRTFARGFDRLVALGPQEIQLGILKRLRGAPIARHDKAFAMIYSPFPPYEILQTASMDFLTLQRLRRMARYWDLVCNSGNYLRTTPLLWTDGSAFEGFLAFADWLYHRTGRQTHGIALHRLTERLYEYLTGVRGHRPQVVREALAGDYARCGRKDLPDAVRADLPATARPAAPAAPGPPSRQARHLDA